MREITNVERKKLLDAAKRIYIHTLMQAKGFEMLAGKAKNEKIKHLLTRLSNDEADHAEFWSKRIVEFGGQFQGKIEAFLRNWKVGFMMRILGTKNFFEWVVVGEEESIQDLAIHAENLGDVANIQTWRRLATDERLHLERLKTDVLGMKAWEIRGSGGVRDMIFGANDGLVSTLAFVAGVFGAITDPTIVLLSGVAELIAGTISMAVGSYQSSKSELEVLERESQRKKIKEITAEEEKEKLRQFYQAEGFKKGEAEAIVERIAKEKELSTQTSTLEELGFAPKEFGNPIKAGVLCGVSFGLAALVPVLPFALPLNIWEALVAAIIGTLITLFGVGAMKTIFSRKSWVWSGLKMMIIGASAAIITYVIGTLFSSLV